MNKVKFDDYKNSVEMNIIRVKSKWYFLQMAQMIDIPQERKSENAETKTK